MERKSKAKWVEQLLSSPLPLSQNCEEQQPKEQEAATSESEYDEESDDGEADHEESDHGAADHETGSRLSNTPESPPTKRMEHSRYSL